MRTAVPEAARMSSGAFLSLQPGYVVAYVGPFPDGRSVWDWCQQIGRSECIGAPLTQDPADRRDRAPATGERP